MGPPAVVFLVTILWIAFTPHTGGPALSVVDVAYGVAWPLSVGLLIAVAWRTAQVTPQQPETDTVAIPLALVVQFGGEFAFLWIANLGSGQPPAFTFSPFGAFLVLLVPWLFFVGDVWQWNRTRTGVSEYLMVAYVGLFGIAVVVIGLLGRGQAGRPFLLFGGLVVSLAGVLALDEYLSTGIR
jgi:hypothetical protein